MKCLDFALFRQGVKILLLYYSVIIIIIIVIISIIIIISIIFHSYSRLSASNVKIYALSFNCIAFQIFFKEPLSPTFYSHISWAR